MKSMESPHKDSQANVCVLAVWHQCSSFTCRKGSSCSWSCSSPWIFSSRDLIRTYKEENSSSMFSTEILHRHKKEVRNSRLTYIHSPHTHFHRSIPQDSLTSLPIWTLLMHTALFFYVVIAPLGMNKVFWIELSWTDSRVIHKPQSVLLIFSDFKNWRTAGRSGAVMQPLQCRSCTEHTHLTLGS